MSAFLSASVFVFDASLVMLAAWLGTCWLVPGTAGRLERLLACGLVAFMNVVASGIFLGLVGGVGPLGFLAAHGAMLLLLGFIRHAHLAPDLAAMRRLLGETRSMLRESGPGAWLIGLLVAIGAGMMLVAFNANPVVFDALTYRLSRIGQWLQDGRIGIIATDDARLNYMPLAPDLVMAWLLTSQVEGFKAAAVAQAGGGLLALGATMGLARLTELSRVASLGAALLLLGMPNVAPQFTAAYTDLFTTGILSASFYLWLAALRRSAGSWVGGAGASLALASKGTVVYFAPGLVFAVAWLGWRHRAAWSSWRTTLLGGVVAFVLFVLPSLVRNQRAYENWIGPADFVVWHHGETPDLAGSFAKLHLNLASSFAQLCEPNSQPSWWRSPVQRVGETVVRGLPEDDPHAFDGLNRRANLEKIYAVAAPDADVTSTGVLLPLVALFAGVVAVVRRRANGWETALAWVGAITGFVLFMHWRLQWNPYQFRFLVLAAPWLAVLAVWGVSGLPRWLRAIVWVVLAATTAQGFAAAMLHTYQSGWPAYAHPGQSLGHHIYAQWRDWSARLDQGEEALRPALPMNLPLAAFYRQSPERLVIPQRLSSLEAVRAEDAVAAGTGWIIVPASRFLGREGEVMARAWLHGGDERSAFSVAAYRALRPGERPAPLLYRNRLVETPVRMRRELQVRTWNTDPIRLELFNPGSTACRFILAAPSGATEGEVAAGAKLWLQLSLPAGVVSALAVEYDKSAPGQSFPGGLEVRLLP